MSAGGMLKLTRKQLAGSHLYLGKWHDFNQWKYNAPQKLLNIIRPVEKTKGVTLNVHGEGNDVLNYLNHMEHGSIATINDFHVKDKKIRGSGFHGPERTDVFRLILYNRLKQKQPQRIVPSLEVLKDTNKLETSIVWFLYSFVIFYCSMCIYGSNYIIKNKSTSFPWMPERTDGSKGEGPMFWFLE